MTNTLFATLRLWQLRWRHRQCRIHAGAWVDERSGLGPYVVLFSGATVIKSNLGDHTYVQRNSTILAAEVGKFCSIAGGVFIGLPRHSTSGVSSHPAFYLKDTPLVKTYSDRDRFETTCHTRVGHDVWIGQNALVMGGVTIGTGSVIGAGAFVSSDVPPYAVVGGVPARLLKYRFSPEVSQDLLASAWWEKPESWREAHRDLFDDPQAFLSYLKKDRV